MKKEFKEAFDKIKPSKDFKERLLESVRNYNNKLEKNAEVKSGE